MAGGKRVVPVRRNGLVVVGASGGLKDGGIPVVNWYFGPEKIHLYFNQFCTSTQFELLLHKT